jgi:hypothetical protein
MKTCWAAALGACSDKISREHLVTASIWDGPTVSVVGFPWCKDEPKDVGIASLTSKVLCTYHNSELSPLDQAAKEAFTALREATKLGNERFKQRPRRWKKRRFEVNGPLLERWFLKTAINMSRLYESAYVWKCTDAPLYQVPLSLVRAAFGLEALEPPLGIYAAAHVGENVNFQDHVSVATVTRYGKILEGFILGFRGMRILLWLSDLVLPNPLVLPDQTQWPPSTISRHLAYFKFDHGRWVSHYIDFMWPGQRVPPWVFAV